MMNVLTSSAILFPRRLFLLSAVCSLALLGVAPLPVFAQGEPASEGSRDAEVPRNVIFILSDDHRYDFMGFHPGAPDFLETPNMDRMAREGAHLANAFVSTALCSPSRASILTGQYAHRHGVVDNQRNVPEGTRFFPQDLQQAGYQTAFIGKWHMGSSSAEPRKGFDYWVSFRGQGRYFDNTFNVNGERVEREGYITETLTDYALGWLEEQASEDAPFFLYLSHKAVHGPFLPAPQDSGRYAGVEPDYPKTMYKDVSGRESWPDWVIEQRSSWHGVDYMYHGRIDYNTFYQRYAETVLGIDRSVGRVLDYLEANGLADETLVIYMGDNGFVFGEHGLIDKRTAFEASMRVPMLAWAPGFIAPGTVIEEMVMNIDVAPTMMDLANTEMPSEHMIDGRSFLPLLQGNTDIPWRDEVLYEYYWEWNYPQTPTQFALRTDRYKYIFYYGIWDDNAFFDLKKDPLEQYNLIDVEKYQDEIKALRDRLFDKLEATGGMQIPLRRPRGSRQAKTRPPGAPSTDPLAQQSQRK